MASATKVSITVSLDFHTYSCIPSFDHLNFNPLVFFLVTAKIAFFFRRLLGTFALYSPTAMSDAVLKADRLIKGSAVMIFSKSLCPACKNSKEVLQGKQKEYEAKGTPFSLDIYELDKACKCPLAPLIGSRHLTCALTAADGAAIQDYLGQKTLARTVPRIFVAEQTLGGNENLIKTMEKGFKYPLDSHWLKKAVDYTAAQNS